MPPIAYTMTSNDKPKARAIPTIPTPYGSISSFEITTLEHPIKTSTNVPINSATYLFRLETSAMQEPLSAVNEFSLLDSHFI